MQRAPRTRTEKARSQATEETPPTSDWSMNTPVESSSSAESQATLTRSTPPHSVGQGGTPAHVAGTCTPEGGVTPAHPAGIDTVPAVARTMGNPARTNTEDSGKRHIADEDGFIVPTTKTLQRIREVNVPSRDKDTRSVRSSKRRAEAEARMMVAKRELEIAEARSKVALAELEMLQMDSDEEVDATEEEVNRSHHVEQWLNQSNPRPIEERMPTQEKKSDIQELAFAISKLTERSPMTSTPKHMIELPQFNGSSEEWLAFKRTFEDTAQTFTHAQNLARLRRSLQGRAREAVKSLLFTAEEPTEVLKGLEARFGRPGALALAELEKLKNLSRVNENPNEVCIFASRVKNAVATIKALGKPQYLSSPETMKVIIEKMSPQMKYRWFAYHRSRREEEQAELVLINEFLEIEADMCGDFASPEVLPEAKKTRQQYAPTEVPRERRWEGPRRAVHTTQKREASPRREVTCPECKAEHWIYECSRFKEADISAKWEMAKKAKICFKCLRYRHSRTNCKAPTCKKCNRWHHVTLHADKPLVSAEKQPRCNAVYEHEGDDNEEYADSKSKITSVHTTATEGQAYLKMLPVNLYGPKGSTQVLALLDEGSTITLLDSSIARKIGAEGKEEAITIETVGGQGFKKNNSQRVQLKIKGTHRRDKKTIEVRTIDNLKLSKQGVKKEVVNKCEHLKRIQDQLIYDKEEPRLLIGQDNWGLIVTRRLKKGNISDPVASLTSLGWVLHGCDARQKTPVQFVNHSRHIEDEDEIESLVRHHFEIDSIGIQPRRPSNDADQKALEILEKTTKRLPTGQFESGLLWKNSEEILPDNYSQAHRRLINLERKLDKDEELKKTYEEQMRSLIENGYAEEAPCEPSKKKWYLPHFAVTHPTKKKKRLVFDAAAKHHGKSLNDALLPGPDMLQSLFGVLIRFRQQPIAVVADIKEMFLRIKIRPEDRDSLRFLWRGDRRTGTPKEYRMSSVIFGAACSPSIAIYVMNKNAEEFKEEYPAAVEAIEKNHYMDDYLQSFATMDEAKKTAKEVKTIHEKAGFHLRGWGSNNEEVLEDVSKQPSKETLELSKEEKTLGLRWLTSEDALAFNVGLRNTSEELMSGEKTPTKREVTSAVMSTFDPLGFATPILIQGKKLLQDIWRTKIGWDEEILEEQKETWMVYMKEVATLRSLKIPRCLSPSQEEGQLHMFSDASQEAYAATVYWRTIDSEGKIHVSLIAGKARVAPTKPVSIPRLELQAALLGSRLTSTIQNEIGLRVTKKVFWTDSSTVLQWIKADPRKFKQFVAHRLAEIEELTRPQDWRWVPTKENPADDATRGVPKEFDHTARWFNGPDFLRRSEEDWPIRRFHHEDMNTDEEKEVRTVATTKVVEEDRPNPENFSSWTRLLRVTARVFQFTDLLKMKIEAKKRVSIARKKEEVWKPQKGVIKKKIKKIQSRKEEVKRTFIPLEDIQLRKAEEALIKKSQKESFNKEILCLKNEKPLENPSRLKRIDVYLNRQDIIKLRSRTRKIDTRERRTNPAILDGRHKITRLIIEDYHRRFLHGNTATVMNEIRQKYWILGLRTTVKKIIHECQWCRVKKSTPQIPPTGDLPIERLRHHQHPFTCTAVDYFGPMHVTVGRRTEKRWGALFTCLTTRAVHVELANSLNTSSMIMALRRMAARRGTPKTIFSDNGTNFVGANRELEEAAAEEGIRWKFIPPGCPNMGGAWERLVRSVKTALAAVLNEKTPPEEVLHTLLTEVEHTVNSRPLTQVSTDPSDEESLTPNHFLIGRSCGMMAPGEFSDSDLIGRANWRTSQRMADHFWQRWIREYLPTLMPRKITGRDTADPQEGDIVMIVDSSLPRNTWPRGQIERTYPGPDGRTRVVDVRTSGGVLRRPTRRVIVLVPATSLPKDGVLRTAGENVSDAI